MAGAIIWGFFATATSRTRRVIILDDLRALPPTELSRRRSHTRSPHWSRPPPRDGAIWDRDGSTRAPRAPRPPS